MPDEFRRADIALPFEKPLFYRLPSNTDQVLNDLLADPEAYVNYKLSVHYVAIKRNDINKDTEKIREQGSDTENLFKYYYHKGMIEAYDQLLLNTEIKKKETEENAS